MPGFVTQLPEINALADGSPGFIWRLQSETGDNIYLRPYDDPLIIFQFVRVGVNRCAEAICLPLATRGRGSEPKTMVRKDGYGPFCSVVDSGGTHSIG